MVAFYFLTLYILNKVLYWLIYIMLTEKCYQLNTINELIVSSKRTFNDISVKQVILGGDFNL